MPNNRIPPMSEPAIKTPEVERIYSLTASRDAEKVKLMIQKRYGFEPTTAYCVDLINFVEALTDGQ